MWRFLRNFFSFKKKTEAKVVTLYPTQRVEKPVVEDEEPRFENVEAFLDGSADLNISTVSDSRSTKFFKEASNILTEEGNFESDSKEMLAMQSYLGVGADFEEQEERIEQNEFIKSEEELMGIN